MALFTIEALSFRYPESEKHSVNALTLDIRQGEFLLLCGPTGCGKTTLLRLLVPALAPKGVQTGRLLYRGRALQAEEEWPVAGTLGFVAQNPEHQIVTDRVWHELAFGLENLGTPVDVMRRRIAEISEFFGIEAWFDRSTDALSGGEKQLVNLAAALVTQPMALLLDEPTAQLDPIAAAAFIRTLSRVNRELGTTVILAEHRLEEAFAVADRVLLLTEGERRFLGSPRAAALTDNAFLEAALPTAARLYRGLCEQGRISDLQQPEKQEAHAAQHPEKREAHASQQPEKQEAFALQHLEKQEAHASQHPEKQVVHAAQLSEQEETPAFASQHEAIMSRCPLTVREGRELLREYCMQMKMETLENDAAHTQLQAAQFKAANDIKPCQKRKCKQKEQPEKPLCMKLSELWFRYEKAGQDILRAASLTLHYGEILCLLGGNGSGKTTLLTVAAGLQRAYAGKVRLFAHTEAEQLGWRAGDGRGSAVRLFARDGAEQQLPRLAYLPQDVQTLFAEECVRDELGAAKYDSFPQLAALLDKHPYDLSGGEQQLLALAKIMEKDPTLLLLDEPTKGLDALEKQHIVSLLLQWRAEGKAVLLVTHDTELAAACADRCGLFFRGEVVSVEETYCFLRENRFYTTAARRISAGILEEPVTLAGLLAACESGAAI